MLERLTQQTRMRDSALPRPIDPRVPSNRVALAGLLGFPLLARLLGRDWKQAGLAGGAAFCAWALGRELDPDDAGSANLALLLCGLAALERAPGVGDLLAAFGVVSAARLEACTVGHAASDQDALALSVQAGLAGAFGNAGAALAPALALLASGAERDGLAAPAWSPWSALGAATLGRAMGRPPVEELSLGGWALALLALVVTEGVLEPGAPHSRSDLTGRALSAPRLLGARAVTLAALALGLLDGGPARVTPLAAAWAATGIRQRRE